MRRGFMACLSTVILMICSGWGLAATKDGLVLSIGQFNQWVSQQLMMTGAVQIWPGSPVAEPLFEDFVHCLYFLLSLSNNGITAATVKNEPKITSLSPSRMRPCARLKAWRIFLLTLSICSPCPRRISARPAASIDRSLSG